MANIYSVLTVDQRPYHALDVHFLKLILIMILWEKYCNHVHFINEDSKALGYYVTCPRFLLNQVVEWEFSQAPDLLLYTISVSGTVSGTMLGTNKSSITIYAFPIVWRYQLMLFHQKWQILCGQSCLLLPSWPPVWCYIELKLKNYLLLA